MDQTNVIPITNPQESSADALTTILRQGAQQLLSKALEAEIESLLSQYTHLNDQEKLSQVVRNGYLPERTIQTGIGPIQVKVPRVRDRGGSGIKFTSSIIPPYLRRSKNIEELLPVLYLKGISSGDFSDALTAIVGPHASGMSSSTICRLKEDWCLVYEQWRKRDLSRKQYIYFWLMEFI